MPTNDRIVKAAREHRTVLTNTGEKLAIPENWDLLPPGDGALTRLVKKKGPSWLVQVKAGKRFISKGIWTKKDHIVAAKQELEEKRATPSYLKKRANDLERRRKKQQQYVEAFYNEVVQFLNFHPRYKSVAQKIARVVTELATPVGSGTVARTERIPLPERARGAVIGWMRHQTTDYDSMTIVRVRGRRRQVRRELAGGSVALLDKYREGIDIPASCPLQTALENISGE